MKCETFTATIFIAGDIEKVRDTCRWFCLRGLCVTITPTEYVFTGGMETGAIIGLINYPRFESTPEKIKETAHALANALMEECSQRSCTVMCSDETTYLENSNIKVPR